MQTRPPMHVPRILMQLMDLMHLKSWPWGPTLDSLDPCDSFDSDQGPNLMNLMNRKWHPGLWIQAPTPIHVPLIRMHLMGLMHLKSWPEIHSIH